MDRQHIQKPKIEKILPSSCQFYASSIHPVNYSMHLCLDLLECTAAERDLVDRLLKSAIFLVERKLGRVFLFGEEVEVGSVKSKQISCNFEINNNTFNCKQRPATFKITLQYYKYSSPRNGRYLHIF